MHNEQIWKKFKITDLLKVCLKPKVGGRGHIELGSSKPYYAQREIDRMLK